MKTQRIIILLISLMIMFMTAGPVSAQLVISNLTVASGQPYEVVDNGLLNGSLVYIDRNYTYSSVPAMLQGATYIKTANDDKLSVGSSFITFDVNQDVDVYVAHDDRIITKPSWLTSFTDIGDDLVIATQVYSIWKKGFTAGAITLGGNIGVNYDSSMYSIIIVVSGGGGSGSGNSLNAADGDPTDAVYVDNEGNVGIGTTNPGIYKLAVNGTIKTKEVVVETTGWSDFVFKEHYALMPLGQLEKYIKNNRHLPQIPSAEDVAVKGINIGSMQSRLLQKIEELTLYMIALEKKTEEFEKENKVLRSENNVIKKRLKALEKAKM